MSALTERLAQARLQVVQCAHDLRLSEAALTQAEITARVTVATSVNGDYKQLGPNESAQKIEMAYRVQSEPMVRTCRVAVLAMQHALEVAQASLECALDERIERQYEMERMSLIVRYEVPL
jgi:hypothetical protein